MKGLTNRETNDILNLAEALVSGTFDAEPERNIKQLEHSTMIRTWGRMAAQSNGLGYARTNFGGGGGGDPDMTVELFEGISKLIQAQPQHYKMALITVYQNGKSITALAQKLGIPRTRVERWVWHGLERLDASLNNVIRMPSKSV